MFEVYTQGKKRYKVENCKELVEKMYKESGKKEDNINEFMNEVSRRNKIYMGEKMEFNNYKEFISECIRYGIIKRIETNNTTIIRGDF